MSRRDDTLLVGAVAYHARIVPIWERFRDYFSDVGIPTDYLLFSNYKRLVGALLDGTVDIAWNTNTAYVVAEHSIGGDAQVLGMRDVDADFATVLVVRRGEGFEQLSELGERRLAVGSRDCGHATILPLYYLAQAGVDLEMGASRVIRFETDPGKDGDTGTAELEVLRAVAEGVADVGTVGAATWEQQRSSGAAYTDELEITWRSPTYYHCNFTALPGLDIDRATKWRNALLAMDYDDPELRQAMGLEGVKRWLPGDKKGYADLTRAMAEQGYLE